MSENPEVEGSIRLGDVAIGEDRRRHGVLHNRYEIKYTVRSSGSQLGSDSFSEIYFRTNSGNIYLLDFRGYLIDSNRSRKKGRTVVTILDREDLESQLLTVGNQFKYGKNGVTTPITQIVCATDRYYDREEMKRISGGKYNPIIEDFKKNMPRDLVEYDWRYYP